MSFTKTVRRLMERYGQEAEVIKSGSPPQKLRAFLQPLRYKNQMYLEGTPTDLGIAGQNYVLFLGPARPVMRGGDPGLRIESGGNAYEVRHCERIYLGDEALYQRAVLRRMFEEEEDGT